MKRKAYSLEWLKSELENEVKLKFLYFWGHTPRHDGSVSQSCLSQWWESPFEKDGITFKTSEHWMMYQKAVLCQDLKIAEKIIECQTPGEAKKLGRMVSNFDELQWTISRINIVIVGNYLKFSQNEELKDFLLGTNSRVLVEASPVDEIWGVGLSKDSNKIHDPSTWRGLNLLGFALMEVRDILREGSRID